MFRLELPSVRSVHLLHGLELREIHSTSLTLILPDVYQTHPVGIIQHSFVCILQVWSHKRPERKLNNATTKITSAVRTGMDDLCRDRRTQMFAH